MGEATSATLPFLLVLAGAFIFAYFCHYTSYQAARVEGQRLLFLAAGWAMFLLVLSRVSLLLVNITLPDHLNVDISEVWQKIAEPFYTPALATLFGAFVWGVLLPWPVNLAYSPEDASARAIRRYGGEIEKLLYKAMNEELMVSVTLENRKVYVGYPVFTPDPRRNTEDFRILPDASGYRSDKSLRVNLTTDYSPVYDNIRQQGGVTPEGLRASDFEIAIPLEKLITVNLFSPDIDQNLFEMAQEEPERAEPRPATGGAQEGAQRPWWRRVFGG